MLLESRWRIRICRRGVVVKEVGSGGVIGGWIGIYAGVDDVDAIDNSPYPEEHARLL